MSLRSFWQPLLGRWRGQRHRQLSSPQSGRRPRLMVERLETRTTPVCAGPLNTCFLNQAYLDLLNRPVDPAGLAFWSNLLDSGFSREQVTRGITASPEFRAVVVQATFLDFLRRPADPGALGFFTAFLATAPIEQMQALVLGSAEYVTLRGGGESMLGRRAGRSQQNGRRPAAWSVRAARKNA